MQINNHNLYECKPCHWVYDEAKGDPDGGIAPGTKFEDIPDDWKCPICKVGKKQFTKIISKKNIHELDEDDLIALN